MLDWALNAHLYHNADFELILVIEFLVLFAEY